MDSGVHLVLSELQQRHAHRVLYPQGHARSALSTDRISHDSTDLFFRPKKRGGKGLAGQLRLRIRQTPYQEDLTRGAHEKKQGVLSIPDMKSPRRTARRRRGVRRVGRGRRSRLRRRRGPDRGGWWREPVVRRQRTCVQGVATEEEDGWGMGKRRDGERQRIRRITHDAHGALSGLGRGAYWCSSGVCSVRSWTVLHHLKRATGCEPDASMLRTNCEQRITERMRRDLVSTRGKEKKEGEDGMTDNGPEGSTGTRDENTGPEGRRRRKEKEEGGRRKEEGGEGGRSSRKELKEGRRRTGGSRTQHGGRSCSCARSPPRPPCNPRPRQTRP
eukprot:2254668-Rhodomonas_salina.2